MENIKKSSKEWITRRKRLNKKKAKLDPNSYLNKFKLTCQNCDKTFRSPVPTSKYCCFPCSSAKHGEGQSGELNPNWKGGKYLQDKYVYVQSKNHPNTNNRGYVKEHRLVMEKHIGRYLFKEEIVHHINGIKNDNTLDNLMLFTSNSGHGKYHAFLRRKLSCIAK